MKKKKKKKKKTLTTALQDGAGLIIITDDDSNGHVLDVYPTKLRCSQDSAVTFLVANHTKAKCQILIDPGKIKLKKNGKKTTKKNPLTDGIDGTIAAGAVMTLATAVDASATMTSYGYTVESFDTDGNPKGFKDPDLDVIDPSSGRPENG